MDYCFSLLIHNSSLYILCIVIIHRLIKWQISSSEWFDFFIFWQHLIKRFFSFLMNVLVFFCMVYNFCFTKIPVYISMLISKSSLVIPYMFGSFVNLGLTFMYGMRQEPIYCFYSN